MASASPSPAVLLLDLSVLLLFFHGASAATHVVGGDAGWIVPGNDSFYEQWSASQSFSVGDVLVFNFNPNRHTVAQVSKENYESCTIPSSGIVNQSPANFTLHKERTYYYICTFPGHCAGGQKVAVTVVGSSSSPTPANGPGVSTQTTAPDTTPSTGTPTAVLGAAVTAAAMGLAALLL